jgi:hypothetical protein
LVIVHGSPGAQDRARPKRASGGFHAHRPERTDGLIGKPSARLGRNDRRDEKSRCDKKSRISKEIRL